MYARRPAALVVLALLGWACGPAARPRAPVATPGPPTPSEEGVAPERLIIDPGDRAAHDLGALDGYRRTLSGSEVFLRAEDGAGPREIRLVPSGPVSRLGLLQAGRLDAADLDESDLAAAGPGEGPGVDLHVFHDFERLVIRFSPGVAPGARESLWSAIDRRSLADVLFPVTGRAADACLPGGAAEGPLPVAAPRDHPSRPLTLLADRDDPRGGAAARRVAAAWTALGVRTRSEALAFPVLRDRLLAGRFDAALLSISRGELADDGGGVPRACAGVSGAGVPTEAWLREACGLFPLVSLDRVVGARADLAGLRFDEQGRVLWVAVRLPEAS